MIPIQVASATVVGQVLGGKNLDRVLEQITLKPVATVPPTPPLTPNERAAVHSISFDTLRHYGLLAAQLELLLTGPMSDAPVRHLLLVALAQLQFSKASDHAIVDHAVSATEALGFPRAKSLVNAVLRIICAPPINLPASASKSIRRFMIFHAGGLSVSNANSPMVGTMRCFHPGSIRRCVCGSINA